MKNISASILAIALAMGSITSSQAADEKKNGPKNRRAVEQILETLGEDHNPEKMKISEVGAVETESTWFHIYSGYLRDENYYRIIIFDNTPKYLGYYEVPYRPDDVGEEEIVLFNEDSAEELTIPLTDKGPEKGIRFSNGTTAQFIAAPEPEVEEPAGPAEGETVNEGDATPLPGEEAAAAQESTEQQEPAKPEKKAEYRTWTITRSGQVITFSAIFVELKDRRTIVLKNSKNGNTANILITELSAADRQYLKEFME